ncbi:conserved hypothetical protein [Verticillium alfalfae VaMs.102]|uniref:Zn(2)-C6 fungal-type domain-containing protein n=1 Tax=Verticillium alfalfae (strain VaMs.102 / ATCC MYA-4576 / FGSC 10136) TaxID=526221 RepID=C9SGC2_VERA1|nr:conserved hypothetical protein [Verticillium alfalfae VaMs.102]EEY17462.1 conserved hypothetical protein [Verticillium alfalfae VaMs.102]
MSDALNAEQMSPRTRQVRANQGLRRGTWRLRLGSASPSPPQDEGMAPALSDLQTVVYVHQEAQASTSIPSRASAPVEPRRLAARACDACRARRRRCTFPLGPGEDGGDGSTRCIGCSRLGIECNFAIPTRPRGPKRRRYEVDSPAGPPMDGTSAHYPPRTSVHSGASSDKIDTDDDAGVVLTPDHTSTFGQSISPASLSTFAFATDELCSRKLFMVIIHDYIERVYPLCPVVHLPSFRRSLASNQDLRKKAFWLQFFSFAHSKVQPGRRRFHVTYLDNYVLRDVDFAALEPLDTPDENITENAVCPPPPDGTAPFTSVTAFIVNTRVFLEALRDSLFNAGCDCGYGRTNEEKLARLKALFQRYKYSLDALPSHMTQWGPSSIYDSGPSTPAANSVSRAQAETTRANIHITHLWLQSFLLDQTDGIVQAMAAAAGGGSGGGDDETWAAHQLASSWAEREDICRQLLHVLHNIDGFHLEPNGNSLTYKIRGVATSLLNCPSLLGESVSQRAAGYVREFTKVLAFLDLSEIMNTDGVDTWIDKDRLGDGRASATAASVS